MTTTYIETAKLPTEYGMFDMHGFWDARLEKEHIALSMGTFPSNTPVLCRLHSECLTGDALFSMRCDCGPQLQAALQSIAEEKIGVLLYLRQEGRGIGLLNKIKAYHLQDQGADTVEANEQLGFAADQREYYMCKPMLDHLNIHEIKLMTNNPRKIKAMQDQGITVSQRLVHKAGENPFNDAYLKVKANKLGHLLNNEG